MFDAQNFSTIVRAKKKMEFLSLLQHEGMSMIEYQAQFLMLKRFEPSNFFSNRELVQYISGLRIRLRSVVATFACRTLLQAVVRSLDCEQTQESHHQTGGSAQSTQHS